MQILWFKRDLRLQDSAILAESMRDSNIDRYGPVLPVYIHEPSLIAHPEVSRQHQAFIRETLDELADDIRSIGGDLLELCGEAVDVFRALHQASPVSAIWAHRETTHNAGFARDNAVRALCAELGVPFRELPQNGIVRGSETPRSFPDYFSDVVNNHKIRDPRGADLSQRFVAAPVVPVDPAAIPVASGEDKPMRARGGRKAAERLMERFFRVKPMLAYPSRLSSPNSAFEECSRLSPYLAYGIVSDKEVFQAVDRAVTSAHDLMGPQEFERFTSAARFFLDRLSWRRDYIQSFEYQPRIEYECMLSDFEGMRPAAYDQTLMDRFAEGRTGFPFVDALLRCLRATGHIHMRGRATLASFATMNLFLPVFSSDQDGVARFLAREFLDLEYAVHFPILQLISGTAPFERMMVYDPVKQAFDHDPQGVFIRKWVPELADLDGVAALQLERAAGHLSARAEAEGYAPYPSPMVDHKQSARAAKDAIKRVREMGGVAEEGPGISVVVSQPSLF